GAAGRREGLPARLGAPDRPQVGRQVGPGGARQGDSRRQGGVTSSVLYVGGASTDDRAPMGTRHLFVGRAHELGDVSAAFDDALDGRGSLFLLVGVAGIGKTRLADELGELARRRGLVPYWGRCWETGGAPVYWPWIQILRELARDQPGPELLAAAGRDAAAVAQLVPELGAPAEASPAEPDPAQARFRLFDAVTSLLKGASRTRPLYLVLDDLHVSDPSSLALLHFVARNLRGM